MEKKCLLHDIKIVMQLYLKPLLSKLGIVTTCFRDLLRSSFTVTYTSMYMQVFTDRVPLQLTSIVPLSLLNLPKANRVFSSQMSDIEKRWKPSLKC